MKIGIDISQIVHEGTGVATYVRHLITSIILLDRKNDYILFGASLRKSEVFRRFIAELKKSGAQNVRFVGSYLPPTLLSFLWNTLHVFPIEWFTGHIDVFWSSDWTQPPLSGAQGITTIHDLSVLRYPEESNNAQDFDVLRARVSANIVAVQKKRLYWVARECQMIICDSQATQADVVNFLHIPKNRTSVVYPGLS